MLTIEKLNEFGVNTNEGLERCLNNKDLYFRLINKLILDESFFDLKEEIEKKNFELAFQISHSLKGVLGNLAITPLYKIIYELTELLRAKKDIDYKGYIDELLNKRNELESVIKD